MLASFVIDDDTIAAYYRPACCAFRFDYVRETVFSGMVGILGVLST